MNSRQALLIALAAGLSAALFLGYRATHAPAPEPLPETTLNGLAGSNPEQYVQGGEPILPLPENWALDPDKVALGGKLFHDRRLSADGSVSCASCHDLARGGADGRVVSVGVGGAAGDINAPSVLTAALNFRQFWDGRAESLEEQAAGPILNPKEMASSWPQVVGKLDADPEMKRAFRAIYPDGITPVNIAGAIAEFERSLLRPSRFDRWLRGDHNAITAEEQEGYQLFKKHGCVGCHQGVNVGGNLFQRFGVMSHYFHSKGHTTVADRGRYNVTGREEDMHLFKVPSLRNVALTAPYFHDGSAQRLEDAVAIMGRYQLGINLPHRDIALIATFLKSLNGEARP